MEFDSLPVGMDLRSAGGTEESRILLGSASFSDFPGEDSPVAHYAEWMVVRESYDMRDQAFRIENRFIPWV